MSVVAPGATGASGAPRSNRVVGLDRRSARRPGFVGFVRAVGEAQRVRRVRRAVGEARRVPRARPAVGEGRRVPRARPAVGEGRRVPRARAAVGEVQRVRRAHGAVGEAQRVHRARVVAPGIRRTQLSELCVPPHRCLDCSSVSARPWVAWAAERSQRASQLAVERLFESLALGRGDGRFFFHARGDPGPT